MLGVSMLREHFIDSLSLNWITDRRPCTVGLEVLCTIEVQACIFIRLSNQSRLGQGTGLGNRGCTTILVGRCTAYYCSDGVTILDGFRRTFQDDDSDTFASAITVGTIIKAIAMAVRRQRPLPG
jgi:hypothetical protein